MQPEIVELLFQVHPLIATLSGERRDRLRKAWIAASKTQGVSALPATLAISTRKETAEALLATCIEISRIMGISGVELSGYFNERGAIIVGDLPNASAALERASALLLHLAAQRLEDRPANSVATTTATIAFEGDKGCA